jgi:hypothetical protein
MILDPIYAILGLRERERRERDRRHGVAADRSLDLNPVSDIGFETSGWRRREPDRRGLPADGKLDPILLMRRDWRAEKERSC